MKRIIAIAGVIILVGTIIATLVVAIMNKPGTHNLFMGLLAADVVIPVMLWGYLMLYRWASRNDDKVDKQ